MDGEGQMMPPDVEIEAVAGSLVVEEGNAKEERGNIKKQNQEHTCG